MKSMLAHTQVAYIKQAPVQQACSRARWNPPGAAAIYTSLEREEVGLPPPPAGRRVFHLVAEQGALAGEEAALGAFAVGGGGLGDELGGGVFGFMLAAELALELREAFFAEDVAGVDLAFLPRLLDGLLELPRQEALAEARAHRLRLLRAVVVAEACFVDPRW
jgi:hypothetical protein